LFIIFFYNLDFCEVGPKCLMNSEKKHQEEFFFKNGDTSIVSSLTHFNFICDNNEMMHGEMPCDHQTFFMNMHLKTFGSHHVFFTKMP
jgi:hypothetical protein